MIIALIVGIALLGIVGILIIYPKILIIVAIVALIYAVIRIEWVVRIIRAFLFGQKAVVRTVGRTFASEHRLEALQMLDEYKDERPTDTAYTRLVIVELSCGDLKRLRELVDLAKSDPRDVLILHHDHK